MEQLFLMQFFSWTCTLRGKKKMYNWPLMTHIYVMWAKIDGFEVVFVLVFTNGSTFPSDFFL